MKLLSLSYCAFLSLSLLSFHYQQAMTPDDAKNEEIIIKKAETEHKAAVLEEKREREAALKKKAKQFIWLQWLDLDKKVGEKPALHKVNGFTDTIDLSEREIMCCAVHASKEIRKKLPELNKLIKNFLCFINKNPVRWLSDHRQRQKILRTSLMPGNMILF